MIDKQGFRANVGIMLTNPQGKLLWAKRVGQDAWQFPQGGIHRGESPEQAMYRELDEEVGLQPDAVKVIGVTKNWLRYRLPARFIRHNQKPKCIGQKQLWFLLEFAGDDASIRFDHSETPEFDNFQWVSYWYPLSDVVSFKREVYRRALLELSPSLARHLSDAGGVQ